MSYDSLKRILVVAFLCAKIKLQNDDINSYLMRQQQQLSLTPLFRMDEKCFIKILMIMFDNCKIVLFIERIKICKLSSIRNAVF